MYITVLFDILSFGDYIGFGHSGTSMGCERSRFEPLICKRDEEEFLRREQRKCERVQDHLIRSGQSSADYSIFKIDTKTNSNSIGTACPSDSRVDEIPKIIGGILVFLLVIWIWRKWNAYKKHLAIRRALGYTNQVALPTVAGKVLATCDYSYLDN